MLTTRRLFQIVFLCALFALALRNVADGDFWWNLRTGQYIIQTRSIPHQDIFSYTRAGQEWVTHEWLSQVFIAALFDLGQFPALIVAFAGIIAASFFLAFLQQPTPHVPVARHPIDGLGAEDGQDEGLPMLMLQSEIL